MNTARFRPDKGFSGVDYGAAGGRSGGPVQFEKDAGDADPFGLEQVRCGSLSTQFQRCDSIPKHFLPEHTEITML